MRKSKKRPPRDPRLMTSEEQDRLLVESARKIDLMEAFFESSEEWKILAQFFDGRLRRLENEGKGLRRRLMRPVSGQPPVTLEQIAAQEARIDENAVARHLDKTILANWRIQIEQLQTIRAEVAR